MTATDKRKEAARLMKSRAGKNSYTQGENRVYFFGKPEGAKGYSDCSSSVRACIKRAAGIDIGGNTSAQIGNRSKGVLIEDNRSGKRSYPDEAKLLPGDCVYYKGNVGHAWSVGHVEMYTGPGTLHGHGSGTGPSKHDLKTYSKGRTGSRAYLCTIRWIVDDASSDIVPADPMQTGNTGPASTDDPIKHGIKITGATVNLRTGPGIDYESVATAKKGEVYADANESGWHPILASGRLLWVSNQMAERL